MKHIDYIIVGDGFAALFFAHQLLKNNLSFRLFSDGQMGASKVSAGMVNPVVLKKFTTFEDSLLHLEILKKNVQEMEEYTQSQFIIDEPVHRVFHDEEEKNTWIKKSSNESIRPFLSQEFVHFDTIDNPYDTGIVRHSFRVDVPLFFDTMLSHLKENNSLISEKFDYSRLDTDNHQYKEFSYSKVLFAEGIEARNNFFFLDQLPLIVNKGHCLKVRIENFSETRTIKKKHFLFSMTPKHYYYGATYDRENESHRVDPEQVERLKEGLKELVPSPFTVEETLYGFRPTVKDRKPLLGASKDYKNLYVFNGLGTRGLLNASYYSFVLFNCIEKSLPIPHEVSIERFF